MVVIVIVIVIVILIIIVIIIIIIIIIIKQTMRRLSSGKIINSDELKAVCRRLNKAVKQELDFTVTEVVGFSTDIVCTHFACPLTM